MTVRDFSVVKSKNAVKTRDFLVEKSGLMYDCLVQEL